MKTRFLVILVILVFLVPIPSIYAPPSVNPDWQEYPYCPGGCPHEYLKTEWAKYHDIKGAEWMEQKKQEMLSSYQNGTLDEWIESDQSRTNQNVFTYYFIAGEIPNHDEEYFDSIPSCRDPAGVNASQVCHTEDTSPCPEPSFRKHGLCVIEKEFLCGKDAVYENGVCRVIHPGMSPSPKETFSFQMFLLAVFSTIAALPIVGAIYWRKNKRFRKIVFPLLAMFSVLLFLSFFFGIIPNSIA